jgi:hypothetical protein
MEIDLLQHVDHRGHQALGQREGGIVLGVAADLQHPLAELGKRHRQVRRGRRLADPALAVDREDLGLPSISSRIQMDLDAAFAVLMLEDRRRADAGGPACGAGAWGFFSSSIVGG